MASPTDTGGCSPAKRESIGETYKHLMSKRVEYTEAPPEAKEGVTDEEHNQYIADKIKHLNYLIGRLRPHVSEKVLKREKAQAELVPAPGQEGEYGGKVYQKSNKITVEVGGKGGTPKHSIEMTVPAQDEDGNDLSREEQEAIATDMAEQHSQAILTGEFQTKEGVTKKTEKLDPRGRAKTVKPRKRVREPTRPGLHHRFYKTDRETGDKHQHFTYITPDGQTFHGRELVREGKDGTPRSKDDVRTSVLAKVRDNLRTAEEETAEEPVARIKKPAVPEREEKRPAGFVSGVPDYPEVNNAVGMTASEYRKAVNEYYRKNNILGSLRDTAKRKSANLRKRENAATGEEKFRLQNMRDGVQDKLKSDEADLKDKLDKKNVDAEHKRLLEDRLKKYHKDFKESPRATQFPEVSRDTIKHHGLEDLEPAWDVSREKEDKGSELDSFIRDKRAQEALGKKPRTDIYKDELPDFEDFPGKIPEIDTREGMTASEYRKAVKDEMANRGASESEPWYKRSEHVPVHWADRFRKKEQPVDVFESWTRTFQSQLSKHRRGLLDKYDIIVARKDQNDSQREFLKYIEASERSLKDDIANRMASESKSFRKLKGNEQKHILGLIRKSVDNPLDLRGDITMSGLFLNLCFFKALSLGEDQKIKAFKNSFGRTSGGVNPPTMNTGELEAEEEHEEERKKEKKVKKSLNLYVRC